MRSTIEVALILLEFVGDKVATDQLVLSEKMTRSSNLMPAYSLTIRAKEIIQL